MLSECQIAWFRVRRRFTRSLIWIQAVCNWTIVVLGGLRVESAVSLNMFLFIYINGTQLMFVFKFCAYWNIFIGWISLILCWCLILVSFTLLILQTDVGDSFLYNCNIIKSYLGVQPLLKLQKVSLIETSSGKPRLMEEQTVFAGSAFFIYSQLPLSRSCGDYFLQVQITRSAN